MKFRPVGLWLFGAAAFFAALLYILTQPDGLPWGVAGRIPQAWMLASLAAGFIAVSVNRYFRWRFAIAASLVWIFLPRVWNGAVLGTHFVAKLSLLMIGLCLADWVLKVIFTEVRNVRQKAKREGHADMFDARAVNKRRRRNRVAGLIFIAVAAGFALWSLGAHDYRLGDVASAYARQIIREANGRTIVLNGVCDEQIICEFAGAGTDFNVLINPRVKDDKYLTSLIAWTRSQWPAETNLAVEAKIGVSAFLEEAVKAHPDRFYVMNTGTTIDSWERRWREFEDYRSSTDRFAPVVRRLFAHEGNAIANQLQETDKKAAWRFYSRICNEVDVNNISALLNLNEMMRKGYVPSISDKNNVRNRIIEFFGNRARRRYARRFVDLAGPVKSDPELVERLVVAVKARAAAALASGENFALTDSQQDLLRWNNEMVTAADDGDVAKAGRMARKIMELPEYRGISSANAVMGVVAAKDGDYPVAEVFFGTALSETNEAPLAVWNDYADTLMHLDRLDEAEKMLRDRLLKTDERFSVMRLTLAEVLTRKERQIVNAQQKVALTNEVRGLLESILRNSAVDVSSRVRRAQSIGELLPCPLDFDRIRSERARASNVNSVPVPSGSGRFLLQ